MKPATFQARVAAIVARASLPEVQCFEDVRDKRIKIVFTEEPDAEVKQLLRRNRFMFRAGTTQAWVRKLDASGRAAARFIMAQLTERTPEDNA